jgi:hypothetical protein
MIFRTFSGAKSRKKNRTFFPDVFRTFSEYGQELKSMDKPPINR